MKHRLLLVVVAVLLLTTYPWLAKAGIPDTGEGPVSRETTIEARIDAALDEGPVLLFFYSTGCSHCGTLQASVRELEREMDGATSVLWVDVDEHPEEAVAFGVAAVPTMIVVTDTGEGGHVQSEIAINGAVTDLVREVYAVLAPDLASGESVGATPRKPVRIGYCTSCSDCSNKLSSGNYDIVKLTTDLKQIGGSCVGLILGESNVVFDCDGHTIDGDDIAIDPDSGVAMMHGSGNTVRNCTIRDFSRGIYLVDSTDHTVSNNTVTSNGVGLYLSWSNSADVEGNTISDNYTGIQISSSNNNDINDNRVCGNQVADIKLESGSGNTGDTNTCDVADGWNDSGTTGCSHPCEGYHVYLPVVMRE